LRKQKLIYFPIISLLRILCLMVPYILLDMKLDMVLPVYLIITFLGEIIDRSEFYDESDIVTPKNELRIIN